LPPCSENDSFLGDAPERDCMDIEDVGGAEDAFCAAQQTCFPAE
jgi:hypothetical protein